MAENQTVMDTISHFRPKHFTMYFDSENFIFTKYNTNDSPILILDDGHGNELHINHCNCGYYGSGPHNTVELLTAFGMNADKAEQLAYHFPAILFDIDNTMHVIDGTINTDSFFESRKDEAKRNQILLSDDILVNTQYKEVFLFNPQNNLFVLLSIIEQMKTIRASADYAEYYIGKSNARLRDFEIPPYSVHGYNESLVHGTYFSLHTNIFKITCFLPEKYAVSFMNCMSILLSGNRMFSDSLYGMCMLEEEDSLLGDTQWHRFFKYFKVMLSGSHNRDFYKKVLLCESERRSTYHVDTNY